MFRFNRTEEPWGSRIDCVADVPVTDSNLSEFLHKLGEVAFQAPLSVALLDSRRVVRDVSILSLYDVITRYGNRFMVGRCVAILAPADTDAGQERFVMDASANRGIRVRYFVDEQQAINWLSSFASHQADSDPASDS